MSSIPLVLSQARMSVSQTGTGLSAAKKGDDPERVGAAAHEFEALLIGQMMRQVREASSSGEGDQSTSSILEMAEQQLAQALTAGGGLGLAKLIVQGLNRPIGQAGPPAQ